MKRLALVCCQIAVTVGCFVWLFSRPEISRGLWTALGDSDWLYSAAGIFTAGIVVFLGMLRWQLFLRVQGLEISLWENGKMSLIGGFFSLVLIGTVGGDAVKVVYLIHRFPGKKKEALLSVLLDRISGLSGLAFFFLCVSLPRYEWFQGSVVSRQVLLLAGIYLIGAMLGIALMFIAATFGWLRRTAGCLPWRSKAIAFADALRVFSTHGKLSLLAVLLSILIHAIYFAGFFIAGRATGANLSWMDTLTLMPVVDSIASLPVSISGLGVRESLFERILDQQLGIAPEVAVSLSLLGFAYTVVWSLLGSGVFVFYRPMKADGRRFGLREVVHEAGRT